MIHDASTTGGYGRVPWVLGFGSPTRTLTHEHRRRVAFVVEAIGWSGEAITRQKVLYLD